VCHIEVAYIPRGRHTPVPQSLQNRPWGPCKLPGPAGNSKGLPRAI
jgi:hypothetical protein